MTTIVTLLLFGFLVLGAKAIWEDEKKGEQRTAKLKSLPDYYGHRYY